MNLNTFLLIDGCLMLIGLPLLMIFKGKRSEEELLEEEIRNQQTLDSFVESDKNWS